MAVELWQQYEYYYDYLGRILPGDGKVNKNSCEERYYIKYSASSSTWVLINSENSYEFLTEDRVFTTNGSRTFARCFDRLYVGDVRKETIGCSGFPTLWIV